MKNKLILHLQSGDGDEGGIANYISLLINAKEMKKLNHIVLVKKIYKKLYLKYSLLNIFFTTTIWLYFCISFVFINKEI